jgi:CubicO group peptidase (beta-lactamase class C family)
MVRTQAGRNPRPGSPGEFYWLGIYGTAFWVDPSEKLIAVLMVQLPPGRLAKTRSTSFVQRSKWPKLLGLKRRVRASAPSLK